MIDAVSLRVNRSTRDVVFLHGFVQGHSIHTLHVRTDQTTFVQLVENAKNATGTIAFLYRILLSIRSQLADARYFTGQLIDIMHHEVYPALLSNS